MSSIEIETSTETVYRWKCHRCHEVGLYDISEDVVLHWMRTHEEHICTKRKYPTVTERI